MKKTITTLVVVGLVVGAMVGPADAGKKRKKKKAPVKVERTVDLAYQVGSPGIPGVVGACLSAFAEGTACIDIPLGPGERYVKVESTDASGTPSAGILAQDTDSASPGFEIFAEFCGTTPEPVAITEGLPLRVSLYIGPSPTCAGITTQGTIKATLSNLP